MSLQDTYAAGQAVGHEQGDREPSEAAANAAEGAGISSSGLPSLLHCIAGLVLLLYAASHIAFLAMRDPSHRLSSIVFPFLTNWTLYLAAALIELNVALFAFKFRGRTPANIMILAFVGLMLWYRSAFNYLGGDYCGCLGLLGRLLHVSREMEKLIPLSTLALLVLTACPWLGRAFNRYMRRKFWRIAMVGLLVVARNAAGEGTIEVRGTVNAQEYNPRTGAPYAEQAWHSTFEALISGGAWNVRVTEIDHPNWWELRAYDGTNSYSLKPFGGGFTARSSTQPRTDLDSALINKAPWPIPPEGADPLGTAAVCLTFGWSPEAFRSNGLGLVEVPIPWTAVRDNLNAWGYRWVVQGWMGGRFLESFQVVRDNRLDLDSKQELFRPEFDYPETLKAYNGCLMMLQNRHADGTNGYVRARYRVASWFTTNGVTLPQVSKLEVFYPPPGRRFAARVFEVKATEFALREKGTPMAPEVRTDTVVADYRYKRSNNSRIFKYAEYHLNPGDQWRTENDAVLLAQADEWLRNGRKYTHFADSGKRWVTWLLLAALLAGPVAVTRLNARQKHRASKNYEKSINTSGH